jgi:anti-sigma factor RsiW
MCNQHEHLIDYLYDECGADERRLVESHLETCQDCRAELAGLRRVRHDLLAWDVPARASVWEPFSAPRIAPWYRQVPAWAMAAAATVMFGAGLAGSVAARAFWPPAMVEAQAQAAPVLTPAPALDQALLEQRVLDRVRAEFSSVRTTTQQVPARPVGVTQADFLRQTQQLVSSNGALQREYVNDFMKRMLNDFYTQQKIDAATIRKLTARVDAVDNLLKTIALQSKQ